jgi:hypothetical protein
MNSMPLSVLKKKSQRKKKKLYRNLHVISFSNKNEKD